MVNWTLGNNLQWNSNRNQHIFIQENAFETVICKITSQPQWYIPSSTTAQHMLWMNHWYYHKHQEAHSLLDLYVHNLYSLHKIFTLIFCVLELSIVLTLKLGKWRASLLWGFPTWQLHKSHFLFQHCQNCPRCCVGYMCIWWNDLFLHQDANEISNIKNISWILREFPLTILFYRVSWIIIKQWFKLTHWGRVTHIYVSKLTIIDSDNGFALMRCQAIIWINDGKFTDVYMRHSTSMC